MMMPLRATTKNVGHIETLRPTVEHTAEVALHTAHCLHERALRTAQLVAFLGAATNFTPDPASLLSTSPIISSRAEAMRNISTIYRTTIMECKTC